MTINKKIVVEGIKISVTAKADQDYLSLTDMLRAKDGEFFIADWLRNRNTIEFLGIWESINNPDFNYGEFAIIKSQAGLNSYKISVKEWVHETDDAIADALGISVIEVQDIIDQARSKICGQISG